MQPSLHRFEKENEIGLVKKKGILEVCGFHFICQDNRPTSNMLKAYKLNLSSSKKIRSNQVIEA